MVEYRQMDGAEIVAAEALKHVRFYSGTSSKRFAQSIGLSGKITDKQADFMWKICYHFRRQLPIHIAKFALRLHVDYEYMENLGHNV